MIRTLLLTALIGFPASALAQAPAVSPNSPAEPGLAGNWNGALDAGGQTLHLVLHLKQDGDTWSCALDSVDQGANGIPCTVTSAANPITLDVPAVHGGYSGTLKADILTGTWTQGAELPLVFTRDKKSAQ